MLPGITTLAVMGVLGKVVIVVALLRTHVMDGIKNHDPMLIFAVSVAGNGCAPSRSLRSPLSLSRSLALFLQFANRLCGAPKRGGGAAVAAISLSHDAATRIKLPTIFRPFSERQ